MNWLRYFVLSLLALIIVALALATHYYKGVYKTRPTNFNAVNKLSENEFSKIKGKAVELKKLAFDKRFSKKFIFLVDMNLPSGKNY